MKTPHPPHDLAELTRFIETQYHAKHRVQLPALAELSEKVETVHFGDDEVPEGLTDLLRRMIGELEVHMKKEELILFPAIRKSVAGLEAPNAAMRQDHHDHADEVAQIRQLANGLTAPDGACELWTRLYAGLKEFLTDLEEHIRLENDVLFPPFETGAA
jgi:regulator of cell morphogenesis and NO signaling